MDYFLPPHAMAINDSPAHAFASHYSRASVIALNYRDTHKLSNLTGYLDEDKTIALIAHLHGSYDYLNPQNSVTIQSNPAIEVLKNLEVEHGKVGTSYDKTIIPIIGEFSREGDYDMALKGLMAIVYRYRSLITNVDLQFILNKFIPADLKGAPDPAHESYNIFLTENAPETENHLLMINSTKYLVNQLFFDSEKRDKRYDNNDNGMTKWLLNYMQTIAKHDFLEFNSRPYQRFSLHALLNLYEFARDDKIRTAARILLDYTMMKFAVSSNRQRRICPFRRMKENSNRTTNPHNELLAPKSGGRDALIGFFLMYIGPTDVKGQPKDTFPFIWAIDALIAGLSTYRPPVAAYNLAMKRDIPNSAVQHRFYHGNRPILPGTNDQAEGGLEIYYSSPSFLLTAGGMFLNSGYGGDEHFDYAQTAIAQSTTLLPTKVDVKFAELIRFDPYPDEREANNTAVHEGFACGANLHPYERKMFGDTSPYAPTISPHQGRLLLAWTGVGKGELNSAKVYTPDELGIPGIDSLEDEIILPDASSGNSPAIVSHEGKLFIAWTDSDNKLNLMFSENNGASFHGKKTFEDISPYAPALVSHGKHLFMAWTGEDDRPNVAKIAFWANTAGGFGIEDLQNKINIRRTSKQAPALASYNGRLFLSWVNNDIYLIFSDDDGASFHGVSQLTDSSEYAPALVTHNGQLFLAWTGHDDHLNVATVAFIGNTAGSFGINGLQGKRRLPETSSESPALSSHNDRLFLAWKGGNNENLYLLSSQDGSFQMERWLFSDLSRFGFYVSIYRTPPTNPDQFDPPLENLGMLYAYDLTTRSHPMGFATFIRLTLARNKHLPVNLDYGGQYEFVTADERVFDVWLLPSSKKYQARITLRDEKNPVADFTSLPLVEGPYLNSPQGHNGYLEISQPGCYKPLVLNFTVAEDPVIEENILACPQPWIDRADALLAFSLAYANTGSRESVIAMYERVKIYERLTEDDPGMYQPALAIALYELLHYKQKLLDPATALPFAQQCLRVYEELAGLRPPGSLAPVNYGQLGSFTPNKYWDHPFLIGALHHMENVYRDALNHPEVVATIIRRVKIYERLAESDPDIYQPELGKSLSALLNYNYAYDDRKTLDWGLALVFAEQCLHIYEELAGLRLPGSLASVDYEQLESFIPNPYWNALSSALFNLYLVYKEVGNHLAAEWWMERSKKVSQLAPH